MAMFEIRDLMVSLDSELCKASKAIPPTRLFLCKASKMPICINFASEDSVLDLKVQLTQALEALEKREDELKHGAKEGPPATSEERETLADRLSAAADDIRDE